MDSMTEEFTDALEGETSMGDFSPAENLPIRKASIEDLCGQRNRALELYRKGYELIEEARTTHARACVGTSSISSFPHDHLRYYTAGEADKFSLEMQHIVDRDMWRAFIVGTPLGSLMDVQERKKFDEGLKAIPPEATPDNVFATMQRLAGEAPMIFRRGLVNAFSNLSRDYRSHDGFKIGERIVLSGVVVYEKNCNWLRTGYRIEDGIKDVDRVMHVLDGKQAPDYQQGICAALRQAISDFRGSGLMECETEYWRLKFFKNGNGHLFPKRKDLVEKANKLIAQHYGMVVGAAPDVATKKPSYRPMPDNLSLDFFPTPDAVIDTMLAAAGIEAGHRVLEPSAGDGAIVKRIMADTGVPPTCVELNSERCNDLKRIVGNPGHVIQGDFLDYNPPEGFDRIVLNPPFSNFRDVRHVTHAISLLKAGGGRLVAIMSAAVTFRKDGGYAEFRSLIESMRGSIKFLPENAFKESGTGVRTVMVTVNA